MPLAAEPTSAYPSTSVTIRFPRQSRPTSATIRWTVRSCSYPISPKTNVVAVNNKKPTGAVKLEHMDVITMGRTQLAFVPFCGEEFDWSELSELKE